MPVQKNVDFGERGAGMRTDHQTKRYEYEN
jgi:hypothetical protein